MSILTWLYLFCAFVFFESALTVYRLHRKAALNKAAGAALFLMAMYCLLYGLFLSAASGFEAAILFRILWTVTYLAVAVMLHFCLMLARSVKILGSKPLMMALYGIPLALNLAMLIDLIGSYDFVRTPWGWDAADRVPVPAASNLPYAFMLVYSATGFVSIVWRSIVTKDPAERKQVASIAGFTSLSFACILIPYFIFLIAGWNPAKDKEILFGNLGVIFFLLIWLSGLRFTLKKHNLFVILPYEPVQEVFSAVGTGILLLNRDEVITFANDHASRLFEPDGGGDMRGKPFTSFLEDPRSFTDAVEALETRHQRHGNCLAAALRPGSGGLSLTLDLFPLFDDMDGYAGCVVMERRDRQSPGITEFQERFSISEREKEIVMLIACGLSNKEIAAKLYISPGTVKNHVYNIYEKTGVQNRVELTRLM